MSATIHSGGLVVKDPSSAKVYQMDWDAENLASGVTLSTSTWAILGRDAALTADQTSTVGSGRKAQVRLSGGTVGVKYTVTNTISTSESPSQTKEKSFQVLIQQE
jgi:hypothetical protein